MNLNISVFLLIPVLVLVSLRGALSEDTLPTQKTGKAWQIHNFPQIGLKMKLPGDWKADIEDHDKSWNLLAFPLVEHPAADVQYRVAISANKYTKSQYLRLIRNYSISNTVDWSGSEHLQTSLMTNAFWVYCRRDIYGTNGFSYSCMGRIKRGAKLRPNDIHRLEGEEDKLATEVRRILDSIESVSTNSAIKP